MSKKILLPRIEVSSEIPVPATRLRYPALELGQSFFVPGRRSNGISSTLRNRRPQRFLTRTVTENAVKGLRVWRIK